MNAPTTLKLTELIDKLGAKYEETRDHRFNIVALFLDDVGSTFKAELKVATPDAWVLSLEVSEDGFEQVEAMVEEWVFDAQIAAQPTLKTDRQGYESYSVIVPTHQLGLQIAI